MQCCLVFVKKLYLLQTAGQRNYKQLKNLQHFKDGLKDNGPTIFERNLKKVFQFKDPEPPRKQTKEQSASFLKEPSSAGCSYKTALSSVTLQVEVDILRSQVSKLENQLSNAPKAFLFDSIEVDSTLVQHYTGLTSADVFNVLLQLCARFEFSHYCG